MGILYLFVKVLPEGELTNTLSPWPFGDTWRPCVCRLVGWSGNLFTLVICR